MKTWCFKFDARLFLLGLLLVLAAGPLSAAQLPGDSLYQLPITLVSQEGKSFQLPDRRGRPQLVSMFYTSCQYVCPLIIDTMKKTQAALPESERAKLDVLLVSFDPERDTTERLKEVFAERKLDAQSWTFARTDEQSVRKLAALLNIQYRALANMDINHTGALILLDADGRIVARTENIGALDQEFVDKLHATLTKS
jgi:protein SCO1